MNKILLKKLSGDSLVYGMSGLLTKFLALFLFPFFARKFSPEDYGMINILNTLTFLVNAIIILGLDSAVTRWFYDYDEKGFRKKIFSNWFFSHFSLAIISCFILFIAGHYYFADKFLPAANNHLLLAVVLVNIILQVVPSITNIYFILNRKPVQSASFSFISSLIATICSLYFVFKLDWGVLGFYLGQSISFFLYSISGYFFYLRQVINRASFDFALLKKMIRYGVNIIPANISAQLLLFVTSLIIQTYVTQADLGYFQVANTLASSIMLITWPFALAFQPISFSIMDKPESGPFYAFILNAYTIVLCCVCLFLGLFYTEIIHILLTKKFQNSSFISGILTFGNFIYSINIIATMGMAKAKKIEYFALVVTSANILTIGLIYFLTRYFGLNGAAIGLLCGQTLAIIGLFYYSQKTCFFPFQFKKIAISIGLAFGLFLAADKLAATVEWHPVVIKCFFLVFYALAVLLLFPSMIGKVKNSFSLLKVPGTT